MNRADGQLLLIGLLLILLTVSTSRALFPPEENPVFLSDPAGRVSVELGGGFPHPGVYQIFDGMTRQDVIKMTLDDTSHDIVWLGDADLPVRAGEVLSLTEKSTTTKEFSVAWMSASKRAALGIPLHPDRMSLEDWAFLPGIGNSLAEKIESNRQKYGDFGTFSEFKRVKGVGNKRLTTWNQYFFSD